MTCNSLPQRELRLCLFRRSQVGLLLTLLVFTTEVHAQSGPPSEPASLADDERRHDFERRLCPILTKTRRMMLEGRRMAIEQLLDEELGYLETPQVFGKQRIVLRTEDIAPRTGVFRAESMTIVIGMHVLRAGPLSADATLLLARSLYHELRHVEHYWRVICWLVDADKTGGLLLIRAHQALFTEAYAGARSGKRPKVTGRRAEEATRWFSQWTSPEHLRRRDHHQAAAKRVQMAHTRVRELEGKLQALGEGKTSSRAGKAERKALKSLLKATRKEEDAARSAFAQADKEYKQIPLEADIARVLSGRGGIHGCGAV